MVKSLVVLPAMVLVFVLDMYFQLAAPSACAGSVDLLRIVLTCERWNLQPRGVVNPDSFRTSAISWLLRPLLCSDHTSGACLSANFRAVRFLAEFISAILGFPSRTPRSFAAARARFGACAYELTLLSGWQPNR